MSGDGWVWISAIIVVALLASLAIWQGRASQIGLGLSGLRVRIRSPAASDDVTVAKGATIAGEVQSITGREIQGLEPADTGPRTTDVAQGMTVPRGGRVGAITGERLKGAQGTAKKPTR
jgi:hypothetical protein